MLWVKGTGVANVGVGNTRQTVAQLICRKPKCFRCGTFGHISAHCPKKQHEKGDERARPIGRHHQKPSKQQRQTKQNPKTQNTKANHTVLTCTTLKWDFIV